MFVFLVVTFLSPSLVPVYVSTKCAQFASKLLKATFALDCLFWVIWETQALAWLVLSSQYIQCLAEEPTSSSQLNYSRLGLLGLQDCGVFPSPGLLNNVPEELLRHWGGGARRGNKARKQGQRGGIRQHIRRATKLPLPQMLLCNPHYLKNKLDELRLHLRGCHEYHESDLMVFTETWFGSDIPGTLIQLDGFSHVRMDRNENSGGEGDKWCSDFAIRDKICNPDLELLCVTLRPHYLPREFTNIFLCAVDIPPNGNTTRAANQIADCVHRHLQNKPEAPMLILGDFNHCNLNKTLSEV